MKKRIFSLRSSLYSKLVATYFVVIFISFLFLALLLSTWFQRYYYNQRKQSLLSEVPVLNDLMINYSNGTIDNNQMTDSLNVLDKLLGTRIWVINRWQQVIATSAGNTGIYWITSDEIENVLKGNNLAKQGIFKDSTNTPVLTIAFPLYNSYNQVIGAGIMNSPLYGITSALKRVYVVIWFSALFAVLISTFVIYFLSQRILTKPLYEINKTARAISNGEFEKRVSISSKDEVGELAQSFNSMADALQNLENLRRDFIANISHELRSPITSIRGFIQGIIDGTIPEDKQKYYLNIALEESKRLTRLISDVLDLSRLESGEFSLKVEQFDINELIRLNIIRFEKEIENKELDVDITLYGDEFFVIGDRDRIGQVISNLVDNAIKFSHNKGKIGISTKLNDKKAIITVEDTGIGIPKEELKLIWDRFHMVDKSRTTKKGTGLGLSIVRQIINQHGEQIWVESREGEGTKFWFSLTAGENI